MVLSKLSQGSRGLSSKSRTPLMRRRFHARILLPAGGVPALTRDQASSSPQPAAFGPYRVLHQIGEGVLGPVYRTYDPEGDRLVAVKVFRLDITPEQALTLAHSLSRMAEIGLSEPGLVTPLTAGVEDTTAYLAQEYVAAESLDVAMRHYAPASVDRAMPFVSQLAGSIDGARAAGVLHGALHPRDILVTPDSAQATGFGIVPALEKVGLRGPVRRPYTAPERIGGTDWGPGADVFSLAVIAYELLTGKRPAGTGSEAAHEIGAMGLGAGARGLEQLFAAALSERPEDRPRTANEFAAGLAALGAGEDAVVAPSSEPAGAVASDGPPVPLADEPPADAAPRPVVEPTAAFKEAAEAWNFEAQEPAAWTEPPDAPAAVELSAAEEARTDEAAEVPIEMAAEPPASLTPSFEISGVEGVEDEAPSPSPLAEPDPEPPVAPVQPPPGPVPTPIETAPEGEPSDELAGWLATVDLQAESASRSRPESAEVDRILGTPEASEATAERSEPEIEAGAGSLEASSPRPGQSLFDASPGAGPKPLPLERVGAPSDRSSQGSTVKPPQDAAGQVDDYDRLTEDDLSGVVPMAVDQSAQADQERKVDLLTKDDLSGVSPMFQGSRPTAPEPGSAVPDRTDESGSTAFQEASRAASEPEPEAEPEPDSGFGAIASSARPGSTSSSDDELDDELPQDRPSKRTPTLPFALALILGILVAFVAGYGLGSRDPAVPPGAPAATPVPAAAAPDEPTAPPAAAAEPAVPGGAGTDADPAAEAGEMAVQAPPVAEAAASEPAPSPAPVDAPGLAAEAPADESPPPAPAVPAAGTASPGPGRLLIRSNPPGAQVVVNDAAAGITPLALGDLPYGDYVIRISRAGYRVELLSVSISTDQPTAALQLDLIESGETQAPPEPAQAPPPLAAGGGTIVIETRPSGVEVHIDGRLVGATPLTAADVPPGEHAVRLTRDGFREWTTTVEVAAGEQVRVAASLEGTP